MPTTINVTSEDSTTPKKRGRPSKGKAEHEAIPKIEETSNKSKNTPKKSKVVASEAKKHLPEVLEVESSDDASEKNTPDKKLTQVEKRSASKPTVNYKEESDEEVHESAEKSGSTTPSEKRASETPKKRGRPSKKTDDIGSSKKVLKKIGRPAKGESTPNKSARVTTPKQRSDPVSREVQPEIELFDLPSTDKILKWASEYKKKLSSLEGNFTVEQQELCRRMVAKLSKFGFSTSNKTPLEALDKFLFDTQREAKIQEGLDVTNLWLIASWRYLRGSFKKGILLMIKKNEDDYVKRITSSVYKQVDIALKAFQKEKGSEVFCSKYNESIKGWVSSLSTISGVSDTTATALLSMFTDQIPYMSQEGIQASMGTGFSLHKASTLDAYLKHTALVAEKLNGKLSAREIETAWFSKSMHT